MQWEGDPADPVPLLGLHKRGQQARLCPNTEEDAPRMKGYAGSIAIDAAGTRVALTSPPGGVVAIFSMDGTPLATIARQDASGVAPGPEGFILTDGLGAVSACDENGLRPLSRQATAWDNHLVKI